MRRALPSSDLDKAADILSSLQPGVLPFRIFRELARLSVMPIIEVVPLRLNSSNKIEILLLKRESDDPIWPSQLHVPGTVIRASDSSGTYHDAFSRILEKELGGIQTSEPVFVRNLLHHSGRGMESSQIYWIEVNGEPTSGMFYDTDSLPNTIVNSQLDFIPDVIASFKASKS